MDNVKNNAYFVFKVEEHLKNIIEYLNDVEDEEFFSNKILQSAVCFEIIQVYENSKKISDEILLELKDFPLSELRGFRNRLVHEYGNVDYDVIYKTAKNDVPVLLNELISFNKKL